MQAQQERAVQGSAVRQQGGQGPAELCSARLQGAGQRAGRAQGALQGPAGRLLHYGAPLNRRHAAEGASLLNLLLRALWRRPSSKAQRTGAAEPAGAGRQCGRRPGRPVRPECPSFHAPAALKLSSLFAPAGDGLPGAQPLGRVERAGPGHEPGDGGLHRGRVGRDTGAPARQGVRRRSLLLVCTAACCAAGAGAAAGRAGHCSGWRLRPAAAAGLLESFRAACRADRGWAAHGQGWCQRRMASSSGPGACAPARPHHAGPALAPQVCARRRQAGELPAGGAQLVQREAAVPGGPGAR